MWQAGSSLGIGTNHIAVHRVTRSLSGAPMDLPLVGGGSTRALTATHASLAGRGYSWCLVPEPSSAPAEPIYGLTQDEFGVWWIRGRVHHVWMQKRPDYCDRGHYIAHVEPAPGAGFAFSIDDHDKWPRYYMDFVRMVDEVCDWLRWREGPGPQEAGEATFGG